ncbi:helix-turn-helix domain-containing protein [Sphingobacterium faecium]|uniref:helix-turn-helix domain-containing protein n=1 Tax=Sphingobacterium faecium TaxID=34087 RepID=UPI002469416E|nr:AraC family transcriptional regulator [Sphingobacterium faecium]MDH5827121.1 AraC family transcriptional regulator [Sphingobacterium faecium]
MEFEIIYTKSVDNLFKISPKKNDFYSVLLCLKGDLSIKIGYHSFELSANMISILAPNMIFSTDQPSDDFEVIQLFFHKSFLQKIFIKDEIINELLEFNTNYPPVFMLADSFHKVLQKFKQIGREIENKTAYHLDVSRLLTVEILYEYNRACEYCLLGFQKNMNRNYQLTYQFKKMVDQHFLVWRSIGNYAESLGITAKHLTEVIKIETGQTALQILHERLLLESQYLLKHTSGSIKECAYLLGFDTPSYFTRFFKAQTGISPQAYRAQ